MVLMIIISTDSNFMARRGLIVICGRKIPSLGSIPTELDPKSDRQSRHKSFSTGELKY